MGVLITRRVFDDVTCVSLCLVLCRAFSSQESRESVDHLLSLLFHHLTSPHSHPHSSHLHAHSVSPITALTAVPRYMYVYILIHYVYVHTHACKHTHNTHNTHITHT